MVRPSPSWRKVDDLVATGRGLPIVLRAREFDSFSLSVKSWSTAGLTTALLLACNDTVAAATQADKVHRNQEEYLNFDIAILFPYVIC